MEFRNGRRRAPEILLSAFDPFGGSAINASALLAHRLALADERLELMILPVVRYQAQRPLLARLEAEPRPRLYIALGEAGPEPPIRLEKVAVNWDDFRIADNAGNIPRDEPILPGGPDARFAPFPVARVARALEGKTPMPVQISLSAGSFLCNHLAYTVAHFLAERPVCPFCFIHVPAWRPEHGNERLRQMTITLAALIQEAVRQTGIESRQFTPSEAER